MLNIIHAPECTSYEHTTLNAKRRVSYTSLLIDEHLYLEIPVWFSPFWGKRLPWRIGSLISNPSEVDQTMGKRKTYYW